LVADKKLTLCCRDTFFIHHSMEASEFYVQEDAPFVPVTTQADAWHVIKLYFKDKGLVRMQIDSFDKFLFEQIPSFISETKGQLRMETNNTISHANMHIRKKEVTIEMGDIKLHRPSQSTPMECRLRGHTYEGAVMVWLFCPPLLCRTFQGHPTP
jgi:DNA-directed RNA polymerase II subunit RPB2